VPREPIVVAISVLNLQGVYLADTLQRRFDLGDQGSRTHDHRAVAELQ
jgi:hypothetical protein